MRSKGFYMRSPQYWRRHYPPCDDRVLLGNALHPLMLKRIAARAQLSVEAVSKTKLCPHWDVPARNRIEDPDTTPAWKYAYCWYVLMENKCPYQAKLDDFAQQYSKK